MRDNDSQADLSFLFCRAIVLSVRNVVRRIRRPFSHVAKQLWCITMFALFTVIAESFQHSCFANTLLSCVGFFSETNSCTISFFYFLCS